jgi:hypothetical protein
VVCSNSAVHIELSKRGGMLKCQHGVEVCFKITTQSPPSKLGTDQFNCPRVHSAGSSLLHSPPRQLLHCAPGETNEFSSHTSRPLEQVLASPLMIQYNSVRQFVSCKIINSISTRVRPEFLHDTPRPSFGQKSKLPVRTFGLTLL